MDLRQLTYFVAIAQRGSFRAAADSLHIAQSALSRHMQLLEHELGGELFERGKGGVMLSETGAILLARAQFVLGEIQNMRAEISAQNRELAGTGKFGAPPSLGDVLFVPIAQHFAREHPRVHLVLSQGLTEDTISKLLLGALDAAIITGPCANENLDFIPCLQEKVYLIGQPDDPLLARPTITLEEIANLKLVSSVELLRRSLMQTDIGRLLKNLPNAAFQVDSLTVMKGLVQANLGYAIGSYSAFHDDLVTGRFAGTEVKDLIGERLIAIPRRRPVSKTTRKLVSVVKEKVAELVANGRIRTHRAP